MARPSENQELKDSIDKIRLFNDALVSNYGTAVDLDLTKLIQQAQSKNLNLYSVNQNYQVRGEIISGSVVGGDFFDLFSVGNNKIGMIIGDVSDKSTAATVFMTIAKTMTHSLAKAIVSPKELMEKANLLLSHYNSSCMFLTAFYAIFDTKLGTLTYCNAGHYPPYLLSADGSLVKLQQGGMALGLSDFTIETPPAYKEVTIQLKRNDCLIAYTDGLIYAENDRGDIYSNERLEKALLSCSEKPFSELIESVITNIQAFSGKRSQPDDITLFGLRYLGA